MNRVKKIKQSPQSIRRTKALKLILDSKGKNKSKCLKEAGFSLAYAHNPQDFMNTTAVKKELDWLKYELEAIRERMEKTRSKAKYRELSDTYIGLSKINQLLGGNPTERLMITAKEREEVDQAFNNN